LITLSDAIKGKVEIGISTIDGVIVAGVPKRIITMKIVEFGNGVRVDTSRIRRIVLGK